MTLTKLLKRLALIPFAYVVALGACGDEGVEQSDDPGEIAEPAASNSAASSSPELLGPRIGEPLDWQLVTRPPPPDVVTQIIQVVEVPAPDAGCPDAGAPPVECPEAQTYCKGRCVSLDSDQKNCGSCGNSCRAEESCHEGRCLTSCE